MLQQWRQILKEVFLGISLILFVCIPYSVLSAICYFILSPTVPSRWNVTSTIRALARMPSAQLMLHKEELTEAWRTFSCSLFLVMVLAGLSYLLMVYFGVKWIRRFREWGLGSWAESRRHRRLLAVLRSKASGLVDPEEAYTGCLMTRTRPEVTQSWFLFGYLSSLLALFVLLICVLNGSMLLVMLEGKQGLLWNAPFAAAFVVLTLFTRICLGPSAFAAGSFLLVSLSFLGASSLLPLMGAHAHGMQPAVFLFRFMTLGFLILFLREIYVWARKERYRVLALTNERLVLLAASGFPARFCVVGALEHPQRVRVQGTWVGYQVTVEGQEGEALEAELAWFRQELDRFLGILGRDHPEWEMDVEWNSRGRFLNEIRPAWPVLLAAAMLGVLPYAYHTATLTQRGLLLSEFLFVIPEAPMKGLDALEVGDFESVYSRCVLAQAVAPHDPVVLSLKVFAAEGMEHYEEALEISWPLVQKLKGGKCWPLLVSSRVGAYHDFEEVGRWKESYTKESGVPEEAYRHYFIARLWWQAKIGKEGISVGWQARRRRAMMHLRQALQIRPNYHEAETLLAKIATAKEPKEGRKSKEPTIASLCSGLMPAGRFLGVR